SAVAVKSSASFYSMWPSGAGAGIEVPAKEGMFRMVSSPGAAFPFSSYAPGSTPDGWLLERRITARTAAGQESEIKDGCGIMSCVIFSADRTFPVAHVSNAALGGAAYLGFEPYEDASAWTLTNTRFNAKDARTGTTSLLLPASAEARLSVTVSAAYPTYVVGFWYKTAAGYTPASGAGATIAAGGRSNTSEFKPTDGEWVLKTIGVPIAGGGSPSIEVTLANTTAADVLLDCVYVVPLAGGMIAKTFDEEGQMVTSSTDAGGRTRWSLYDRFSRPTLQVGPNGQPKELAQRFLSRQGNSGGGFETTSPNAELTLHPADGGSVETFLDGGAWQQVWQPADPQAWQASGRALSHVGTNADTLVYKTALPATWAVYFEVSVGSKPPALSLSAGAISVSYSGSGYTGWGGAQPLATPPRMARHWLLVVGDGVALLFGDGQLIFSVKGTWTSGPPSITTSADLTFSNLAFLASPRVSLSYKDGSGRQRQVHQLYGADSRVSEVIFDPLGRKVATTRVAPGSFGSGASLPVLSYRPGFVDVAGFMASLGSSWKMTGDIADYYQGQVVNKIQRSNDQSYPYRGTKWEASPRKRKVEVGLPGLPYAIHDISSTTPAQRMTTQFAYGSNSGTNPELPAAQYSQTTVTTPLKHVSYRVNDKVGQSVASVHQGSTSEAVAQSAGVRSYAQTATGPQVTLNLRLPNAIIAGPQSGDESYVLTTAADAASRAVATSVPDSGQTQFLYDPCGRVRFVQPAMENDEEWFFYTRYDAVGRVVEQGTAAQKWDPRVLGPLAAEPGWPTPDVPRTVSLELSYDGDGNDPTLIGQKTGSVTRTPAPRGGTPCVADEAFTYDAFGQVIGAALSVSGPASSNGAIGYSYNNLGELTAMKLPSGSPLAQVFYTMNDQGWVTGIGSSADSRSDIAAYTYSADGAVETESLGNGAWARAAVYTSPGWVQEVVTTSADNQQRLSLSYTYNADGNVATREIAYAFGSSTGELSDVYTYDGQGRLVSAQGSSDDHIDSYDPNGNIFAVTQRGASQSFTQVPGSDQLRQAVIGGSSSPVSCDVRGRVTSALGRTLSYDDATNLTVGGSMNSNQVQFGYGGRRQRVLKQVSGEKVATTTYFTGLSGLPVARLDGSTWTALVYGPTGLVATYSDQAYYPLKDNEHNAWAVVNSKGLVGRYVYLPFGGIVAADGPNPAILPYTFMGQEWDAELLLYNFRDRMYDPLLRRYLTPDPQRQFPSPYVFCANNPLSVTDPTGDSALWARIGIGIAMGAMIIAGIAVTIATAGAAAPALATGEGALAGLEAGGEVAAGVGTATAGAEGGGVGGAAAAGGEAGLAEGGTATAGQVGAGAGSGAGTASSAAAASSITSTNFGYLSLQAGIGIVEGTGISGLQYDIQNGRTFTVKGFFESAGWGALSGLIGGVLGGIPGMPALQGAINSFRPLAQFGINVVTQGVVGAAASDLTQILANISATGPDHPAWYSGLLQAALIGGGAGAVIGGFTSGVSIWATDLKTIGNQAFDRVGNALDSLQAFSKTDDAKMLYGTAAFFVIAGFSVWGVTALVGKAG
ncbi:MAG TPA: RHS repeat-associated core domain-containing protein, partial [Blastocatellia bacterium]|nr:RHS repeat-associated core domain-containing protein [Blastocatellia bacterium]